MNVDLEHCDAAMIQWQGISADSGPGLQLWLVNVFFVSFVFCFSLLHFNGNDNVSRSVTVTTQPRIISYLCYALMFMWIPSCLSRFACVCIYKYIYLFFTCFAHSMPIPCERNTTVQTRTNIFIPVSVNLIFWNAVYRKRKYLSVVCAIIIKKVFWTRGLA